MVTNTYCPAHQQRGDADGQRRPYKFEGVLGVQRNERDERGGQFRQCQHGHVTNGPVWTTGKVGNALSFDGTNDFVSVPDNATLDLGGTGTLAAWVRLDTLNRWHSVIAKGNANDSRVHNYALEITDTNRVYCNLGNNSSDLLLESTTTLATGQFRHLACTWNGTTLSLYIDGVLNTSRAQTLTPAGNTAPLYIGQYGGNSDRLDGIIDEVRIYNSALTREIQA